MIKIRDLKKALYYIIIFLALLTTTITIKYTNKFFLNDNVSFVLLNVFCTFLILWNRKTKISTTLLWTLAFACIYLAIYILFSHFNVMAFVLRFIVLFSVLSIMIYSLIKDGTLLEFLECFSNVVVLVAGLSLFFWIFGTLLRIMPGRLQMKYYWDYQWRTCYSYFLLYFENPIQSTSILGFRTIRNCGIFTEAPGFTAILAYALCYELWIARRKIFHPRSLILYAALLSSLSSKGLVFSIVIFMLDYLRSINNRNSRIVKFISIVAIIILVLTFFNGFIQIYKYKTTTASYSIRVDDFMAELKAWRTRPFIGYGYMNNADIRRFARFSTTYGLSMGITALLAYGGIMLFAFYVLGFILSFNSPLIKKHRYTYLCFITIILINLAVSNTAFSVYSVFLLALAYTLPSIRSIN